VDGMEHEWFRFSIQYTKEKHRNIILSRLETESSDFKCEIKRVKASTLILLWEINHMARGQRLN
jgi:hypothetical protein